MWQRTAVIARPVTTPADADANGSAWPAAIELAIPQDWSSGFYDVSLSAPGAPSDRAVSRACFVVCAVQPTSSRLLVVATNT